MNATLFTELPLHWNALDTVRLGGGSVTSGKVPDRYVIVEGDGIVRRFDLYPNGFESYAFEDAKIWRGLLLVGYGCHLYVFNLATHAVSEHHFDSYFGHLYVAPDYCLVASGCSLYRLGDDGEYLWASRGLALDGVVVNNVRDGVIYGDGEWDPPGGWRPFSVRLSDGGPANWRGLRK